MRRTNEYKELLGLMRRHKNIMICEMDVPSHGKRGLYGKYCNGTVSVPLNLDILNELLDDPSEAFGH